MAPSSPSTTRTAMIASRYSVAQSSSLAGAHARIDGLRGGIAAHGAAFIEQHFDERREMCRGAGLVDEQGLGRAADAGPPQLRIAQDRHRLGEIGVAVDIDMIDAFEMREDRHARLGLHAGDEALAAARHDDIEIAAEALRAFRRPRRGLSPARADRRLRQACRAQAFDETVDG